MRVANQQGVEFDAVQYIEGEPLPDGVFLEDVNEGDDKDPTIVTKAFLETKDTDGDRNIDGAASSIGDGCIILTAGDDTVSIVHPTVFQREYREV